MKLSLPWYFWLMIATLCLWLFGEVIIPFSIGLLTGWYFFLCRVLPSVRVNAAAIILSVSSFAGFVLGCRWLGRLIARARASSSSSSTPASAKAGTSDDLALSSEMTQTAAHTDESKVLTFKQSFVVAGLVLMLCVISIAATATVHATYWLMAANPPDMKIEVPFRGYVSTRHHLKSIGLALLNYHDTNGSFPTGGTFLPDGTQGHSWMTRLTPYVDRADVLQHIHASEPWYSEHNAPAFRSKVHDYEYPSRYPKVTSDGFPTTCFAANQYVMGLNTSCSLKQIIDGTSNTLAVGEIRDNPPSWGDPRNFRDPFLGINRSPHGFGGNQPNSNSAHFLLCDGSVRTISAHIDPKVLGALGTPNGNETVPNGYP